MRTSTVSRTADPFDFDEGSVSSQRPRRKSGMSTGSIIALTVGGVVIVLCVLLGLLGGFILLRSPFAFNNPNVTQANLDRITLDMRLKEVEAIMGGKGSKTSARDGALFEWRNEGAFIIVGVADRNPGPESKIVHVSGGGWKH
jgi:hypothetical protein